MSLSLLRGKPISSSQGKGEFQAGHITLKLHQNIMVL